jgi:pimeloyl-ACP methyl ester carboxylesterase
MTFKKINEGVSRREFASLAAAGLAAALANGQTGATDATLDIAEWSYFWVGVERAELARGTVVNGRQMYVEYQIPAEVRHPYPIVLVHGGGGQGLDWMGTPDGRRGWATFLLQEGYTVYVVDRPGHGRSPYHPETHGAFPAQANTLESISGRFTPPNAKTTGANEFQRKYHNQWPGTGEVGSSDLDQFVASQGGAYVSGAGPDVAHAVWRERGAMLLDKIGPAIFITQSAGGPFGWLVAEIRPSLVKAIIAIEGGGQPFAGANVWGMSTIPVAYDPPVSDAAEIKTVTVTPSEAGVAPYKLQAEPARKLKNLRGIPIVVVTSEGSFASPGNPGAVAYFKQAGCTAEELRLADHGVHGNGHIMMGEKNNRQVLQPILDWIDKNVSTKNPPKPRLSEGKRTNDSTTMKLADQGYFWVGTEHKKVSYGTILTGQMYVQYLIPAQVRHPYPVVLVHGGGGSMLHYMGMGDGRSGWAHYYAQEGYKVYLVDRPGHGRAPYHPDALGPMSPIPAYQGVTADFMRAATGPNRKWMGTGDVGDPLLDQFQAGQNAAPQDNVFAHKLWASRGAELLEKIGPSIIVVHSAGGPFGWIVANERPRLVKAIVSVEGAGAPLTPQTPWGLTDIPLAYDPPVTDPSQLADGKVHKLKNLQGIPIVYVTSEKGRTQGPAVVSFLKQAGCQAEDLLLKDKGILGNGHFMMVESNRRQVFDAIQAWLEKNVKT